MTSADVSEVGGKCRGLLSSNALTAVECIDYRYFGLVFDVFVVF